MTCKDCAQIPPYTASCSMHCKACVDRWLKRISSEEHKKMVNEGLKSRFLTKGDVK
jgi:uncharacterized Zn ribbon protein